MVWCGVLVLDGSHGLGTASLVHEGLGAIQNIDQENNSMPRRDGTLKSNVKPAMTFPSATELSKPPWPVP